MSKKYVVFRGNGTESREDILGFQNVDGEIDVILFGGSDVLRFYDPLEAWHQYGYTSYNYATSSAQADMLRFYAEESRKTHKPSIYVFDLRTITFVNDIVSESSLRNWSDSVSVFSFARIKGIYSYLFNRDWSNVDVPSYFIDLFKYHTKYDSLASPYQWSYTNERNIKNVDKGFAPYINHTPFVRPVSTEERGEISDKQLKALKELLDYCDNEHINVLFICSPIVITEKDQMLMNSVSDYIVSRGYEFIDFNKLYDEIGIDFSTDYGDVNHVNYIGALKFTDYFINLLIQKYNLPDHQEDKRYASWNVDYEAMAETRASWLKATQNAVDNHLAAKQVGEKLPNIDNFLDWYVQLGNDNYVLIIRINEMPKDLSPEHPFFKFASVYGIDSSQTACVGAWKGTKAIVTNSNELTIETKIGTDGGKGTDKCLISIENKELSIAGRNYYNDQYPIQIIVYDYNFKTVLDNVTLQFKPDEIITMIR